MFRQAHAACGREGHVTARGGNRLTQGKGTGCRGQSHRVVQSCCYGSVDRHGSTGSQAHRLICCALDALDNNSVGLVDNNGSTGDDIETVGLKSCTHTAACAQDYISGGSQTGNIDITIL